MSKSSRALVALSVITCTVSCSSDYSGFIDSPGGGGGGGIPGALSESVLIRTLEPAANLTDLSINGAGTIAVYASNENPLGSNPAGIAQIYSVSSTNPTPVQITTDTGNGFLAVTDFDIDDSGTLVVFPSSQDLTGNNPTHATNIFLASTDGSSVTQVTAITSGVATNPRVSGDGSTIVFASQSDLTGGNPLNTSQIFSIGSDGSNLAQVTMGTTSATQLAFANDGTRIVWQGRSDPFGTNADGSLEIFAINVDGTNHMQLTMSGGNSTMPRISDDGAFVVFRSAGEFTPGSNPDAQSEVYVVRGDGTGLVRITNQTDQPSGDDYNGAPGIDISGNGQWVVFGSWSDILGINPDHTYTIYWARADGTVIQQLLRTETKPAGVASRLATFPLITNDGGKIIFEGLAQYSTGAPAAGHKIYSLTRE